MMASPSMREVRSRQASRKLAERRYELSMWRDVSMMLSRGFDGATTKGHFKDWRASRASADALLLDDLPELRARSRELVRDDPHAAALIQTFEDNVVGTGIRPQARATAEDTGLTEAQIRDWNRACEQIWRQWAKREADATGHDSFSGLQRLVYRHLKEDGEGFVHPIRVSTERESWLTLATSLEVVDPDRVGDPNSTSTADRNIRSGIEIGDRRQAIAYLVSKNHPDDLPVAGARREMMRIRRYRNGRRNMIHVFKRLRADQSRGIPILSPSITTFRQVQRYLEAELTAARVSACIAAFVKRNPLPEPPAGVPGLNDGFSEDLESVPLERLAPGIIEYLEPGEEIQTFKADRPGTTFEPFLNRMLRSISSSTGLPFELLVRDFSKTNYSSMRAALLETRRTFRCDQQMLIDQFCQPVWELVIEEAYLRGLLPRVPQAQRLMPMLTRTRWVAPPWGWVDPTKEIQASTLAIEAGLSTRADEAAANGGDWEEIQDAQLREVTRARDLEEKHDLPSGVLGGVGRKSAAPSLPTSESDDSDPQPEEVDGEDEGDSSEDDEGQDDDSTEQEDDAEQEDEE